MADERKEGEFYADGSYVYQWREDAGGVGVHLDAFICATADDEDCAPEGTAETIAYALNRTPVLELALVAAAQAMRSGDAKAINAMADEIEELIVNG